MKTAVFATILAAAVSAVVAAPGSTVHPRGSAAGAVINVSIPASCKVCDTFGLGCVAACVAGGPLDPFCDICAGVAIGPCLNCIAENS